MVGALYGEGMGAKRELREEIDHLSAREPVRPPSVVCPSRLGVVDETPEPAPSVVEKSSVNTSLCAYSYRRGRHDGDDWRRVVQCRGHRMRDFDHPVVSSREDVHSNGPSAPLNVNCAGGGWS